MKVVRPNTTNHTVSLIPRFTPIGTLEINVKKEGSNDSFIVPCTYLFYGGVMILSFDLEGLEGQRYSCIIHQNNEVLTRFRLLFTEQEIQEFKQTKGKYIYV